MTIMCDIRKEMRDRARLARGLANALSHDADYVYTDVESFDLICLDESLRETKETLQRLTDNITEIEYLLYLLRKGGIQE